MSTRFERRRERARRRRHFEEITAWIVLPLIVVVTWLIGSEVYTVLQEPIATLIQSIDRES
ncbi:hypothetical protein [Pseudochelatococcus sp. G4_1912]|uniref:hypothetical protein n=1 Tax=Pseudochelatococcus sp. G4_1912 TaxID=3114288 RepID=UPI0039C75A6C